MFYPFAYDTLVTLRDFGPYHYVCVNLPEELEGALPFDRHPRLRVKGEIAGYDFEGAWQPQKGGPKWLMIPKDIQKAAGMQIGDPVHVAFEVTDQNAVHVPLELAEALEEAGLEDAWNALTAGKRRGLAITVEKAKAPETKAKRIAAIFDLLEG